jgi:hypothetical protein
LFASTVALALGVCISASAAPAQKAAAHWEALTSTALAITGDILLSESRITFENGASLELAYVGIVPDVVPDLPKGTLARIYRVVHPQVLVLLHRNRLCGEPTDIGSFSRLPYYMAVSEERFGDLDGIMIAFLVGPLPVGPDPEGRRNCDEFGFVRPQDDKNRTPAR